MERSDTSPPAPVEVSRLPARLRPLAERALDHWLGRFALGCMVTSRRIELFDRSMTLAAQIFTSVLPILIALASLVGRDSSDLIGKAVSVPPETQGMLEDVLAAPSDPTFGVLGVLIVLVSATSLSRAMTRACAALWGATSPGQSPLGRLAVGGRGPRPRRLPGRRSSAPQLHGPPDAAGLLGQGRRRCRRRRHHVVHPGGPAGRCGPDPPVAPGALLFASVMLFVRPASEVYLPHALNVSAERYGSIGVAFTYLAWLYVVAFCFLITGVMGKVIATDEGRVGSWIRGPG